MTLWILDTDHLSLLQREHPGLKRKVTMTDPKAIAITIVTAEEQVRGRLEMIRRAGSEPALVLAYARLRETLLFLQQFVHPLAFSDEAYRCYMELKRQKIRIGSQDLRIASIAISVNGIVVTRNQRDFGQIPGLPIEDWTTNIG